MLVYLMWLAGLCQIGFLQQRGLRPVVGFPGVLKCYLEHWQCGSAPSHSAMAGEAGASPIGERASAPWSFWNSELCWRPRFRNSSIRTQVWTMGLALKLYR